MFVSFYVIVYLHGFTDFFLSTRENISNLFPSELHVSLLPVTKLIMYIKAFLEIIFIIDGPSQGSQREQMLPLTIHSGDPSIALESRKHCKHGWSGGGEINQQCCTIERTK